MPQTPSNRNLNDWLAYLEIVDPAEIELRLENVQQVANVLQIVPLPYRLITVAGTNGKGSSVAMLSSILQVQGYRVGTYTSPHLLRYNERVTINGNEVLDEELIEAFTIIDQGRSATTLTYFEFGTLAAHLCFRRHKVDVAVMEVGLGGRLDAVNAFDPDASLVTSIGLDHQRWLGHTRNDIGKEKAAIFRPDLPAVCSDGHPPSSIKSYAKRIGAEYYQLNEDYHYKINDDDWKWQGRHSVIDKLPRIRESTPAQYQNAAGVIMVLRAITQCLTVTDDAIRQGLESFSIPGRLQVISQWPSIIVDVAHNQDAVAQLLKYLNDRPIPGKTLAVFALLDDKDSQEIINLIRPVVDSWYIADLATPRTASATKLAAQVIASDVLKKVVVSTYKSPVSAFRHARRAARQRDRIVVFGSFYLVGDIIGTLQTTNQLH